ncbi:MAG: hypothetical protein PHR28_08040 [candidate division Zixibacteria bacterium]|jgi:hypothetical protein|nr:hypothetical protein [candidate division Zixibacteria bacterium]
MQKPVKQNQIRTCLDRAGAVVRRPEGSLAQTWLVVLVCLFVLMLTYAIFHPFITTTMYSMVEQYGGNMGVANNIKMFLNVFPVIFMTAIMVWAFMVNFRREDDRYRR